MSCLFCVNADIHLKLAEEGYTIDTTEAQAEKCVLCCQIAALVLYITENWRKNAKLTQDNDLSTKNSNPSRASNSPFFKTWIIIWSEKCLFLHSNYPKLNLVELHS